MLIYTDTIDYQKIADYEKFAASYVKDIIDIFFRKKFKEFDLDVIITISRNNTPFRNLLYHTTLFVEPLYKNQRILYKKQGILFGGFETRSYTSFIDIINYELTVKKKNKEKGKYQARFEDDFSELFTQIEVALGNLKTNSMEIDTDEYPERILFYD